MPRSPTALAAHANGVALPVVALSRHDQINAEEPEREPNPLQEPHALAEPAAGDRRGQHRLQAQHQRDHSGRQPVPDRDEHAAETEAMHQQAGDRAMRHAARARPFRPRQREYRAKQHHDRAHAQRQERQRFGIGKSKLGADKASRPQHDEHRGRRKYDEVLQSARHETWDTFHVNGGGWWRSAVFASWPHLFRPSRSFTPGTKTWMPVT